MGRANVVLATRPVKLAVESRGQKIDHAISIVSRVLELKVRGNFNLQPGQIVEVALNDRPQPFQVAWVRPPHVEQEAEAGLELLGPMREMT